MTARAIAVELMRLAGHDAGDRVAVEIVANRVRALLTRRVGLVERVAVGPHRRGWRIAAPTSYEAGTDDGADGGLHKRHDPALEIIRR
jgi:hypothetical protein